MTFRQIEKIMGTTLSEATGGECAEYTAALGEVLESRDKKCSRIGILQKYTV